MSQAPQRLRIGRSIRALFAGFLLVVILSITTDLALHSAGIFPESGQRMSDPLLLLATAYRTVYGVAGSFVTARLAPNRPLQHALIGGTVGLVISLAGALVTWNKGPAFGPHWYPLALIVLALPQAWLGGILQRKTDTFKVTTPTR